MNLDIYDYKKYNMKKLIDLYSHLVNQMYDKLTTSVNELLSNYRVFVIPDDQDEITILENQEIIENYRENYYIMLVHHKHAIQMTKKFVPKYIVNNYTVEIIDYEYEQDCRVKSVKDDIENLTRYREYILYLYPENANIAYDSLHDKYNDYDIVDFGYSRSVIQVNSQDNIEQALSVRKLIQIVIDRKKTSVYNHKLEKLDDKMRCIQNNKIE